MIQINLLPDVKRELLRTRAMRNFIVSVSMLVGIGAGAVVVVLGLFFGGQLAAEVLQDRAIKEKSDKLMAVEDLDKSVTLQHQLLTISALHGEKSTNSRLFDVISSINPPAPNDVRIETLKYNPEDNTIVIEGSAKNGYLALEVFKKTITSTSVQIGKGENEEKIPLAENIEAGMTSFGENAEGDRVLRFSFTFKFPTELFASSDQPVAVVTPGGRVDVTDSRLGVPESLFGSSRSADDEGGQDG